MAWWLGEEEAIVVFVVRLGEEARPPLAVVVALEAELLVVGVGQALHVGGVVAVGAQQALRRAAQRVEAQRQALLPLLPLLLRRSSALPLPPLLLLCPLAGAAA